MVSPHERGGGTQRARHGRAEVDPGAEPHSDDVVAADAAAVTLPLFLLHLVARFRPYIASSSSSSTRTSADPLDHLQVLSEQRQGVASVISACCFAVTFAVDVHPDGCLRRRLSLESAGVSRSNDVRQPSQSRGEGDGVCGVAQVSRRGAHVAERDAEIFRVVVGAEGDELAPVSRVQ